MRLVRGRQHPLEGRRCSHLCLLVGVGVVIFVGFAHGFEGPFKSSETLAHHAKQRVGPGGGY